MITVVKLYYTEVRKKEVQVKRRFWFGLKSKVKESIHRCVFEKEITLPDIASVLGKCLDIRPFAAYREIKRLAYTEHGELRIWIEEIDHTKNMAYKSMTEQEVVENNLVSIKALTTSGWKKSKGLR